MLASTRSSSAWATLDIDQGAQFDATKLLILVGDKVSLVPEDPTPHTAQEVAVTATGLCGLGNNIVDKGDEGIAAARETNRLINLMSSGKHKTIHTEESWNKITTWKPSIRSSQY